MRCSFWRTAAKYPRLLPPLCIKIAPPEIGGAMSIFVQSTDLGRPSRLGVPLHNPSRRAPYANARRHAEHTSSLEQTPELPVGTFVGVPRL